LQGFVAARGIEFPDVAAVRTEAVVLLGEMVRDIDGRFWGYPEWRLTVVDESGATVCELQVSGR
jgi:hypothetical protein